METLVIAFICLNSAAIGAVAIGYYWMREDVRARRALVDELIVIKADFKEVVTAASDAHNNQAKKIIALEDKMFGLTAGMASVKR